MGFRTYKRTELDEQGNPYPILYMKIENKLHIFIAIKIHVFVIIFIYKK